MPDIEMVKLQDGIEKIREVIAKMKSHTLATHARHEEVLRGFEAIEHIAVALSDLHTTIVAAEIQKLTLKPGDALIVKLGDRSVGWIPSEEQQKRCEALINELLERLGLKDVPALLYHYGIELEVIERDLAKMAATGGAGV